MRRYTHMYPIWKAARAVLHDRKALHMQNMTRREALAAMAGLGLTGFLGACGKSSQTASSTTQTEEKTDDIVVRVASLKGPTTIGLVNMMNDTAGIPADGGDLSQAGEAEEGSGITYAYQMSSAPDEVLPLVIQGTADIALVPSNAAAVLYAKTKGKVQVIDLNTLGVLSVVTGDSSIQQFEDLAGKTIYISGKGSSPEYVMNYLLEQAGIADSVTMEWQSEHTEVASVLASDPSAVGVLPQPFTTATLAQNSALAAPIDLTDVWEKYAGDTGSLYVMGATIVRSEFAEEHPQAVADFLSRHAASVQKCSDDVAGTAALVVQAGIVAKEPIAEKAIPQCNIVCMTGDEMKDGLSGYLQVLYDADASSVGGALPEDDFYYNA